MTQLSLNPKFIKTKNVRNFEVMMTALDLAAGEGRLGLVYGRAGRGKTRTSQWYAAHNDCVYLRMCGVWSTSVSDFLRALCRELRIVDPPKRKGAIFATLVDHLTADPIPVFLDEPEKLPRNFLDVIRDLSDLTGAPFVLVGEEELVSLMRRNRRVWSRTYQQLQFDAIGAADIILYTKQSADITLSASAAGLILADSGGDFRIVRRDVLNIVHYANARGTAQVDDALVKIAIKTGLTGQ